MGFWQYTCLPFVFRATLLGKVLRLDVDVPQGSAEPYSVPDDNPFINEAGTKPEIYAYGIRNIWRCDVDEGDALTGKIFAFMLITKEYVNSLSDRLW